MKKIVLFICSLNFLMFMGLNSLFAETENGCGSKLSNNGHSIFLDLEYGTSLMLRRKSDGALILGRFNGVSFEDNTVNLMSSFNPYSNSDALNYTQGLREDNIQLSIDEIDLNSTLVEGEVFKLKTSSSHSKWRVFLVVNENNI